MEESDSCYNNLKKKQCDGVFKTSGLGVVVVVAGFF